MKNKDVSEILKQGRLKNKEEMEQLLSTHGGNFKTDFGLRETMEFEEGKNANGMNKFISYIQGNIQDQRIEQAILNMKKQNAIDKNMGGAMTSPLSPVRAPSKKPESITELTKLFTSNASKMNGKKKKTKPLKMIQNFRQKRSGKKGKFSRNQPNFKTPPPNMNYATIDPTVPGNFDETAFQHLSEEPEFQNSQREGRKLNMLKASMNKISVDFAQDRQFLKSVKKKNNFNQFSQVGGSQFIKSQDAFSFEKTDSKLPSINQSTNVRNSTIKSPVMESIRMSRSRGRNPQFMSLQKFRPGASATYANDSSDDGKSEMSTRSRVNIHASYVSK